MSDTDPAGEQVACAECGCTLLRVMINTESLAPWNLPGEYSFPAFVCTRCRFSWCDWIKEDLFSRATHDGASCAKDLAEEQQTRERLSEICNRTVNAIKGPPPEDVWWSFHDLPELAAKLVEERDLLAIEVSLLTTRLFAQECEHLKRRVDAALERLDPDDAALLRADIDGMLGKLAALKAK